MWDGSPIEGGSQVVRGRGIFYRTDTRGLLLGWWAERSRTGVEGTELCFVERRSTDYSEDQRSVFSNEQLCCSIQSTCWFGHVLVWSRPIVGLFRDIAVRQAKISKKFSSF